MKKNLLYYLIIWAIVLGFFNVFCFVLPEKILWFKVFSDGFWPAYIFITVAFILHLILSMVIFSNTDKKQIENTPIFIVSILELGAVSYVGIRCMFTYGMTKWLTVIICSASLAISAIILVILKMVEDKKYNANKVLNDNTLKMRELTDKANQLVLQAKDKDIKKQVQKVYESIRFSNLSSYPETVVEENEIEELISVINNLLKDNNISEIEKKVDELIRVVENRNNKCKLLKSKLQ